MILLMDRGDDDSSLHSLTLHSFPLPIILFSSQPRTRRAQIEAYTWTDVTERSPSREAEGTGTGVGSTVRARESV